MVESEWPQSLQQRFQFVELLGDGSQGAVCRARPRGGGKDVAIKIIDLAQSSVRDEVLREAANLSSLRHPNIVQVYDVGFDERHAYIVMEHVHGSALATALRSARRFSKADILTIVAQLASALDHMHQRGIVHCDLSPANVLLVEPGGAAKIIDLGVAVSRLRGADIALAGTPGFSAPEIFQCDVPDGRADLFSIGVLVEALARTAGLASDFAPLVARLANPDKNLRVASPGALYRTAQHALRGLRDGEAIVLGDETGAVVRPETAPYLTSDETLAKLRRVVTEVRAGEGRVVTVSGPSGCGKSRLVAELVASPELSDAVVLRGACLLMTSSLSFAPLTGALDELTRKVALNGALGVAAEAAAADTSDLLVRLAPGLARALNVTAADKVLTENEGAARERVNALAEFFARLGSASVPMVLLIDDLQWADASTLRVIERLAAAVSRAHCLVVCAYRDDAPELEQRLATLANRVHLTAEPITAQALAGALPRVLGLDEADAAETAAVVVEATAGNAFFVWEVCRALSDAGAFPRLGDKRRFDAQRARGILAELSPAELLGKRIVALGDAAAACLAEAAVWGRVFSAADLGASARVLMPALGDQLIARDGDRYVFTHDKVCEAAYALLPEARRRERHAVIARVLEARGEHEAAVLHYEKADDRAAALGCALTVIERSDAKHAFDGALELARKVDAWVSGGLVALEARRQLALVARMAHLALTAGLYEVADEAFLRVEGLQARLRADGDEVDKVAVARALGQHGIVLFRLGRVDESLERFERSLLALGERYPKRLVPLAVYVLWQVVVAAWLRLTPERWLRDDVVSRERALLGSAFTLYLVYRDSVRCLAVHLRATNEGTRLRPGVEKAVVTAQHAGSRFLLPGLLIGARARRYALWAERLGEDLADPWAQLVAATYRMVFHVAAAEWPAADEVEVRAEGFAKRALDPAHLGLCRQHRLYGVFFQGRLHEATERATALCRFYESFGDTVGMFDAHFFTGEALLLLGRRDEARELVEWSLRMGRRTARMQDYLRSRAQEALLLIDDALASGDPQVAALLARRAHDAAREVCTIATRRLMQNTLLSRVGSNALVVLTGMRRLRMKVPITSALLVGFQVALVYATAPAQRAHALLCLGRYAEASGAGRLARWLYRRGVAVGARYATRFDQAACLLALGRDAEAFELLRELGIQRFGDTDVPGDRTQPVAP